MGAVPGPGCPVIGARGGGTGPHPGGGPGGGCRGLPIHGPGAAGPTRGGGWGPGPWGYQAGGAPPAGAWGGLLVIGVPVRFRGTTGAGRSLVSPAESSGR